MSLLSWIVPLFIPPSFSYLSLFLPSHSFSPTLTIPLPTLAPSPHLHSFTHIYPHYPSLTHPLTISLNGTTSFTLFLLCPPPYPMSEMPLVERKEAQNRISVNRQLNGSRNGGERHTRKATKQTNRQTWSHTEPATQSKGIEMLIIRRKELFKKRFFPLKVASEASISLLMEISSSVGFEDTLTTTTTTTPPF